MPSLGGYVYSLSSSYLDPHSIIYGVGDNLIRVWNTRFEERPYETSILWQGIKSKVTVVSSYGSRLFSFHASGLAIWQLNPGRRGGGYL